MKRAKRLVLTIPELPPTLNEIIGSARYSRFSSASTKKKWTARIKEYCSGAPKFTSQVHVEFVWFIRNFSRDADNVAAAAKYILDGLVDAHVLTDDNLRVVKSPLINWYEQSPKDYVEVYIYNEAAYVRRIQELQKEFTAPTK